MSLDAHQIERLKEAIGQLVSIDESGDEAMRPRTFYSLRADNVDLKIELRHPSTPGKSRQLQHIAYNALQYANGVLPYNTICIQMKYLPKELVGEAKKLLQPIHGEKLNVIVLSDKGGQWIYLPALHIDVHNEDPIQLKPNIIVRAAVSLTLTSHTQLLLKILILSNSNNKKWWSGGRFDGHNGKSLADFSQVNKSTCYRFIKELKQLNYLDENIQLHNKDMLIRKCLENESIIKAEEKYFKPILSSIPVDVQDITDFLSNDEGSEHRRWALGSWSACHEHEFMATAGDYKPRIHIAGPYQEDFYRQLSLTECERNESSVIIHECSGAEADAVFYGSIVSKESHVHVVDVWQATLDVIKEGGRGVDQAWSIAEHIMEEGG